MPGHIGNLSHHSESFLAHCTHCEPSGLYWYCIADCRQFCSKYFLRVLLPSYYAKSLFNNDNFPRPALCRGFSNTSVPAPHMATLSSENVHLPWTISTFPCRPRGDEIWHLADEQADRAFLGCSAGFALYCRSLHICSANTRAFISWPVRYLDKLLSNLSHYGGTGYIISPSRIGECLPLQS